MDGQSDPLPDLCFADATRLKSSAVFINVPNKKEHKDQESIQSNTKPDPGYQWESDNVTIRRHKREPLGQPFPSRCMKA